LRLSEIAIFSKIVASFKKILCGTIAIFFCQANRLFLLISISSIINFPSVGFSSPIIIFVKVLLPAPVLPFIAILSPLLISKLTLLRI
tara:strand:+ start:512 stop:775 length:264 start_codon:yes stop_codon:yes gene_type:complete